MRPGVAFCLVFNDVYIQREGRGVRNHIFRATAFAVPKSEKDAFRTVGVFRHFKVSPVARTAAISFPFREKNATRVTFLICIFFAERVRAGRAAADDLYFGFVGFTCGYI